MKTVSRRALAGLLAMTAPSCLHAQILWPGERPIQIIAAYPPGGGIDVNLRAVVPHFESLLPGARFSVLNRPGAGIGYTVPAMAPPDGYTIGSDEHRLMIALEVAATMRDPARIAEAERLFIPLHDLDPAATRELVFREQAAPRKLWTRRPWKDA